MSITNRTAIAATALAVALAPAALAKGGPPDGHGNPPTAQHGKGHQKAKKVVAKGTVVSYDATAGTLVVHVTKANHHGAGMVGTDVSFDVSKAKLVGGPLTAADKVVVKTTNVAGDDGRYAAKQVVDQTHPETPSGSTDSTDS